MQWDPPSDNATIGYVLWYGPSPGKYTAWTDVGFVVKHKLEGLADATTYCFAVQAYSASGESSPRSQEVCGKTPAGASPPPPPPPPDDDGSGDGGNGGSDDGGSGSTDGKEIVLHASDAVAVKGNWTKTTVTGAAGGRSMRSADKGFVAADAPFASPGHYFELQFNALANTPYRVWLRLRAGSNSRFNDSVWVQFSDSLVSGRALYKIGTTSALAVNLETCANCGVKGWGWSNSAYWLKQGSVITFARSGTQKIRVQTREDGIEIDQVVLSAATYVSAAPGLASNDTTILSKTGSSATPASTPYTGTPIVLPGTINAAYFDNGGAGVAYTDSTAGNTGGVFRNTDVDLQPASVGGHNIAWTTAGESVTYTVNVSSSGTYTATFMVASVGGGTVQVVASAPSGTSKTVTVPNTGGSQNWNKVSVPLTLVAGQQKITVKFQTANVNFRSLTIR